MCTVNDLDVLASVPGVQMHAPSGLAYGLGVVSLLRGTGGYEIAATRHRVLSAVWMAVA